MGGGGVGSSARWMTRLVPLQQYDHFAKSIREKKTLLETLNLTACRLKSIRKQKIRPYCRKNISTFCLFGFVEAKKFRDSSEYSDSVQNVRAKGCLPCQCYIK